MIDYTLLILLKVIINKINNIYIYMLTIFNVLYIKVIIFKKWNWIKLKLIFQVYIYILEYLYITYIYIYVIYKLYKY